MIISNLKHIPPDDIINCLVIAFENYYVKVSTDHDYWIKRWQSARVDYELSVGIFDDDKLVGFVLHGIDTDKDDVLTAFNCGTGILPQYRKRGFVKELYDYIVPQLQQKGVKKCGLEVITQNDIALQSYERVGFETVKKYKCFFGKLQNTGKLDEQCVLRKANTPQWDAYEQMDRCNFSWENDDKALKASDPSAQDYWELYKGNTLAGYAAVKQNGHILQFGTTMLEYISHLFDGIAGVAPQVRILNIEDKEEALVSFFIERGLVNTLDQYYMEYRIG